MSRRLRDRLAGARAEGRTAFIGYVTAGYPTAAESLDILLALQAGGADVIEIGVPFSDPMADGATIQRADEAALRNGMSYTRCLALLREARAAGLEVPVLFMGYYNPLLAYGEELAVADAAASGADGFIVVDLPPDEASDFLGACRRHDMSFVPLIAPTTRDARLPTVTGAADAFLYCVSVLGTTGSRSIDTGELPAFLDRVRAVSDLPLGVGFGISRREHVVAVGRMADAAIVGTAIIAAIDGAGPAGPAAAVREYVEDVTGRSKA
jgi:tryptophan synthase